MARATPERLADERLQIRAGTDGVIRHWGTGLEQVYGYRPDEAVGRTLDLIVPRVLRTWHWRGFDRAIAAGHPKRPGRRAKVPAIHRDGSIIEVRAWPRLAVAPDGKVEHVVSAGTMRGHAGAGPLWRGALALLAGVEALRARLSGG